MPITVLTDPADWPFRTQDQESFDSNVASTFQKLPIAFQQMNAMEAGMNSLAAGGVYAIPYTHRTSSSNVGGSAGGMLAINASSIQLDTKSAAGASVTALLNSFDDSTSSITGTLRLQKVGDTSKWAVRTVTSYVQGGTGLYGDVFGTLVASSNGGNPFVDGDLIMVFFQRTGDKGDTGSVASFPNLYVRYEVASGAGPDSVGAGSWVTRAINTVKTNNISGASLASNVITLPAGTYECEATVPAASCNGFRGRLYNNTDAVVVDYGTSEYNTNGNSYPMSARSSIRCQFTIAATKTFTIQHYQGILVAGGMPGGAGANEIYTEAKFRKIA